MLEIVRSPYLDRQLQIDDNVASGTMEPIIWEFAEVVTNPNGNKAQAVISVGQVALIINGYTLSVNNETITFGTLADISIPRTAQGYLNSIFQILNNNPQITGRYNLILSPTDITIVAKKQGSKYDLTVVQSGAAFITAVTGAVDIMNAQTFDDYAVILEAYIGSYGFLLSVPSIFTKLATLRLVNDGSNQYTFDLADLLNQLLILSQPEYYPVQKYRKCTNQAIEYTVRYAEYYNGEIQGSFINIDDCRFWAVKGRHTTASQLFYFNWRRSLTPYQFDVYALTNSSRKNCHWNSFQWIYWAYNWIEEDNFGIEITLLFENGVQQVISDPTFIASTFNESKLLYLEVSPRCFDFVTLETANSSELKEYTISILDDDTLVPIVKPITYVMDNCNRCQDEVMNVIYENTYGGFDTLTPLNFEETKIDVKRLVTDRNNTFYTQQITEVKIDSGWIAGEFADSFVELLNSKQIFLLSDRYKMTKCTIKDGSYIILKKGDMNKMEFTLIIYGLPNNG